MVATFPASRDPGEMGELRSKPSRWNGSSKIHLSTALRVLRAPAPLCWKRGAECSMDPGLLSAGS